MDYRLEVIGIPVSDVDRSIEFYVQKVGFNLDHDVRPNTEMRVVQMTPRGSACSVVIGSGMPIGEPGAVKGTQLVVDDLDAAQAELRGRGVEISDIAQLGPEGGRGSRFAFFKDPDGNQWAIQELKPRDA